MAQGKTNKLYRTFVKGLMTEASPLTYPEDTSFDELNTVPSRKGNRQRRPGMNYNPDNATPRSYDPTHAKNEFMWNAVASIPALSFLVVQNGTDISFYDRSQAAFASNKKTFTINLNDYTRSGVSDVSGDWCQFAAGKGFLFIVGSNIEPIVISYDSSIDNITVTKIVILARDFDGLYDNLQNDEEPPTLSRNHLYNLKNQGWVDPNTTTVVG